MPGNFLAGGFQKKKKVSIGKAKEGNPRLPASRVAVQEQ